MSDSTESRSDLTEYKFDTARPMTDTTKSLSYSTEFMSELKEYMSDSTARESGKKERLFEQFVSRSQHNGVNENTYLIVKIFRKSIFAVLCAKCFDITWVFASLLDSF